MSLLLAPEIIGFLKKQTRIINRDLKEATKGVIVQNGMPPSVILGDIKENHFISNTTGDIEFIPGKVDENGLVLPISLMTPMIHIIRKVFLPGGSPIEGTANALLGDDPKTSNAIILVLPLITPDLSKISRILESIANNLGISVILVETETDTGSMGSVLAEVYRFASEILDNRARQDLRPIVVLPSIKTLTSPVTKEMIDTLREMVIEGMPQQNWIKLDAMKLTHSRVLKSLNLDGTRAKIIGASQPFLHSGVNVMVVRTRISGDISYPIHQLKDKDKMVKEEVVEEVLRKYSIPDTKIQKVLQAIPRKRICYSDTYFASSLSSLFSLIRKLRQSTEVSCEIAKDILEKSVICNRKITREHIPVPPPAGSKYTLVEPKPGSRVWYREEEYLVVWEDKKAGLLMIIPELGLTQDRVIIPYSYAFVSDETKGRVKLLIPGAGTCEYVSVCEIKQTVKRERSKETIQMNLEHICVMERGFILEGGNTPFWGGVNGTLKWKKDSWRLVIDDEEYLKIHKKSKWTDGWCGSYTNGTKTLLVSERHGSMYDGASMYLKEQDILTDPVENVAFAGRPELSGEHREYITLRLGMFACLSVNKSSRVILHGLGEGGIDPQLAWLSYILGRLKGDHGLRYIADDVGIQELQDAIHTLPMIRFHSLTETPVYKGETKYTQAISNPDSKMNQFITFVSDPSQLFNLGWKLWGKGGPPLYRPPNKVSGIASVIGSAKMIVRKASVPMYSKITPECIAWGVKYGFHKLRACVLVSIRSNGIHSFTPMVKHSYKNTYDRGDTFWFGKGMNEKRYLAIKNRVLREMKLRDESFSPRGSWFANNSLIGNVRSNSMNDGFTLIAYHMIQQTLKTHAVGDCDFILNVRDFPKLRYDGRDPDHAVHGMTPDEETPVMDGYEMPMIEGERRCIPFLGFNTHPKYADIPIVDPDSWANAYGGYFATTKMGGQGVNEWVMEPEIWGRRETKAVFRGSATGYGSGSDDNQRLFLAEMFKEEDDIHVNYAITSGAVRDRKTDERGMRYIVPEDIALKVPDATMTTRAKIQKRARMPMNTSQEEYEREKKFIGQDRYKFILYVDGNAGAYRYTNLMKSGFCILKVDSLIGYEMWMYASLKEALPGSNKKEFARLSDDEISALFVEDGDHITIGREGENIRRIIEWAKTNDEKVRQIAMNAIRKYKNMCNVKTLTSLTAVTLNVISKNQEWSVPHATTKHDIAEPSISRDIIRTLDRVTRSEKEHEAIMMAMDQGEAEPDMLESTERFIRPSVSTQASEREADEGKVIVKRLEEVDNVLGDERPRGSVVEMSREYPSRSMTRRGYHGAIKFLTSKVRGGTDADAGASASAGAVDVGADLRELI